MSGTPCYAQLEYAERRMAELEAKNERLVRRKEAQGGVMGDILCNDCLDTGWNEDREGRTVCSCISETEPYQLLQAENEALKKCCSQRGARMEILLGFIDGNGTRAFIEEFPESDSWFDEDGRAK